MPGPSREVKRMHEPILVINAGPSSSSSPGDDLPLVSHKVFEKAKLARLKRDRPTRTFCSSRP
jgi:hypothetical protein